MLRSMELGPRDRLSQAFIKEQEKGRTLEGPYGHYVHLDMRHLGEKVIDKKLPFVRELCLKYEDIDPVKELIPVRPVVHYMMGGISHRHPRRHAAAGALRGGRGGLRQHQRRQPAGLELADRAPGLRRAGRPGGRGLRRRSRRSRARRSGPGPRRAAAARGDVPAQDRRAGADRHAPRRRCRRPWRRARASTGRAPRSRRRRTSCAELQERFRDVALDDHSYTFNTELTAALELAFMLDVARGDRRSRALHAPESRGLAPAHRLPEAGRRASSWRTRWPTATRMARPGSSTCR